MNERMKNVFSLLQKLSLHQWHWCCWSSLHKSGLTA